MLSFGFLDSRRENLPLVVVDVPSPFRLNRLRREDLQRLSLSFALVLGKYLY